jgi:hypothetical protein
MYAAGKNKIKERGERRENNVWDGWANLWGIRRRKSVESVNWDELKSIVCVEEPSGTPFTPVHNRIGGRDQCEG